MRSTRDWGSTTEHSVPSRVSTSVALLDVVVDAVQEVRESSGAEVEAVGFGIPCLIDQRTGTAVVAVHLPLADIAFADVMAERLGLPVFVDNDGNTAAIAEHRAGAARGASEAVVMTLGTGIGGGLILRGEPYRGCDRRRRPSSGTW